VIGLRSLSVALPETIRTNDDIRASYPELVADAERRSLAHLFRDVHDPAGTNEFDDAMARHLVDPFRGTVERRVLASGESALALETRACRGALAGAKLAASDVDLVLLGSFLPDRIGVGNGAFLVRELGLRCPVWHVETACTTAIAGLELARSLIAAGSYRHVLVAVSCSYSRYIDPADTLGWFMGDAAGAFVVADTGAAGVLGTHAVHTAATCETFRYELALQPDGSPRIRLTCSPETGRILRDTSAEYVRAACLGAARAAGVELRDIGCFVFNTPTAWFHEFAARVLDVDPSRTLTTYPRYANIGPALMPVNLHEAARLGLARPGELVCAYSIGSVSSAGAAVMRWGDVALVQC
jgi:3-oxoacyl-[acyl-carrier-protein] synthase III